MRIVFDTNALISATLWDNSVCHKLLIKLINSDARLFTSIEIINEYRNALMRDFRYTKEEIETIIPVILNAFSLIIADERISVIKEDAADNRILECAVSAAADFILSYDNHLLKIKEFRKIRILTPTEFLKIT